MKAMMRFANWQASLFTWFNNIPWRQDEQYKKHYSKLRKPL